LTWLETRQFIDSDRVGSIIKEQVTALVASSFKKGKTKKIDVATW